MKKYEVVIHKSSWEIVEVVAPDMDDARQEALNGYGDFMSRGQNDVRVEIAEVVYKNKGARPHE